MALQALTAQRRRLQRAVKNKKPAVKRDAEED
jgi:hypothetical protein